MMNVYIDVLDLEAGPTPLQLSLKDKRMTRCLYLLCALSFCLGVSELVVASITGDTTNCDNSQLMKPIQWLMGSGVISLCFTLAAGCTALTYRTDAWKWRCGYEAWACVILVATLLMAWNITGSFVLWRDNLECQVGILKHMIQISLLVKYLMLIKVFLTPCC